MFNTKWALRGARPAFIALSTLCFALVTPAIVVTVAARAQGSDDNPAPPAENYYAAGNRIDILTPMTADVVVAGRTIAVTEPVAGDILAAGWEVTLAGHAADDVRLAGASITIDAPVDGDVTVAGGTVTVGPLAHVRGRSWMTGNDIRLDGTFDREVRVAGRTVQIGGEVRRPLQVVAESLELLPSARLLAPLTYKGSSEARIAAGALVTGPIAFERIAPRDARRARTFPAVSTFLFTMHPVVAGLLTLLLPRIERSIVDTLRARPWQSLLTGFTLLVTIPAAALALVLSLVALPLGLALGGLYVMSLFVGIVVTAFFVGELESRLVRSGPMETRRQQAAALIAGALTLAALRAVIGGLAVFVSVLFGLGALTLWLYHAGARRAGAAA